MYGTPQFEAIVRLAHIDAVAETIDVPFSCAYLEIWEAELLATSKVAEGVVVVVETSWYVLAHSNSASAT